MTSRVRNDGSTLLAADGTPRLPHVAYDDEGYPYSDGARFIRNMRRGEQLFYAVPALQTFLRQRFPDAFSASDLLIYPRPRDLKASVAPDFFVAFGASDDIVNSYKLWKGEPTPAFVLEVHIGTTADNDLGLKRDKYAAIGIAEFWVFDPFGVRLPEQVAGYRLRSGTYRPIPPLPGTRVYPSDVLGLEFRTKEGNLRIHDPVTGEDLRTHEEEHARRLAETARLANAKRAYANAKRAYAEANRAYAEAQRAKAAEAEVARLKHMLDEKGSAQPS